MPQEILAYRYRIYCDTEAQWVEGWSPSAPTECFNDPAHTVTQLPQKLVQAVTSQQFDTNVIGSTISNDTRIESIRLQDDSRSDHVLEPHKTSTMLWMSPPHPTVLYGMHTISDRAQADDYVNLIVEKDTVVGVLAAPVSIGDTKMVVANPPVNSVAMLTTGYCIGLNDGSGVDALGDITNVLTATMTIHFQNAATKNYAAGTAVTAHQHVVRNLYLGNNGGPHTFGLYQEGSVYFPPNSKCTITYTNVHPEPTYLSVDLEIGTGAQNLASPV